MLIMVAFSLLLYSSGPTTINNCQFLSNPLSTLRIFIAFFLVLRSGITGSSVATITDSHFLGVSVPQGSEAWLNINQVGLVEINNCTIDGADAGVSIRTTCGEQVMKWKENDRRSCSFHFLSCSPHVALRLSCSLSFNRILSSFLILPFKTISIYLSLYVLFSQYY